MDVVFGLIPLMLFFGFLVVVVFIWMAKTGHFDDLDGAANSIFMDDEYEEDKSPLKSKEKEINQETSAKQSEKQTKDN
jgi:cbb3-type cytochrome oxidase maturation protein